MSGPDRLINTTPLGLRATLQAMVTNYRESGCYALGLLAQVPPADMAGQASWMALPLHVTEVEALIAQLSDQPRCERKASGSWWTCHFCRSTWQISSQHAKIEPNWRPPGCPERPPAETADA